MLLTSSNLDGISHGFFTRKGGVSSGIYASLNCGLGTGDNPAHVTENRVRVAGKLGVSSLITLYQVHGDKVITVDHPWAPEDRPQADAMVTNKSGIVLGILTADCVPVLFADEQNRIIGAAHAGWKGVLAGVLERTVEAMLAAGAGLQHIRAAIGPCIAQPSYEVSAAFKETFLRHDALNTHYFIDGVRPAHFMFDIRGYANARLKNAGVADVNLLENDTYIEEDAFFSFRRATHRGEPDYGRQVSAIMLTP